MSHETDAPSVPIEVRRGSCTPQELAALVAVVTEAYSDEADAAVADDSPQQDVWSVTRRGLRTPLRRDVRWGRFLD